MRLPAGWRRFPGEVLSGPRAEVGERRAGAEAREPSASAAAHRAAPPPGRTPPQLHACARFDSSILKEAGTCHLSGTREGNAGVSAIWGSGSEVSMPAWAEWALECRADASSAEQLQL